MNTIVLKIFEKDNFLIFVYKKVECIVSASYLLSNFLSDKEPIKWQFRDAGVGLLSRVLSLTSNQFSKSPTMSEVASDLLKFLSLLNISFTAGFVSEMNFNILKKELESLIETLHYKSINKAQLDGGKPELDKEFFAIPGDSFFTQDKEDFRRKTSFVDEEGKTPKMVAETWPDVIRLADIHKRHNKGQNLKDKVSLKIGPIETFQNIISGGKEASTINNSSAGRNRQTAIMKLLNERNNLTIKDFFLVIKGCSEKTIQRELLRLVRVGVLKKSGERRWSRYSLVLTA